MMPMPYRFLTSLAVRHRGQLYLFDAGEGCQINLKKAKLGVKSLRLVAVSHLHADHCLGLPGFLMLRAQVTDPGPLTIVGPPGIERFVSQLRELLGFFINYPINFGEWNEAGPEVAYEDEFVRIQWSLLEHSTLCLGYRLEEHRRPGKFRPEAAQTLGVPEGPLWGRLQRGESIVLETGITVMPDQVAGPARPGRHICYAVDTRPNQSLDKLCQGVDAAFLEGMFLPEDQQEAEEKMHMTVVEAAQVAANADARLAVLVHVSPRYVEEDLEKLAVAVTQKFQMAKIGRDLDRYSIPHHES
jgi:ribonuclease Z